MQMSEKVRRIAHLDMDAFFASVELLHYPELRGQAVVVGGRKTAQPLIQRDGSKTFTRLRDYIGRGVATTSTYEARALGVFSGMGLMKSAHLAPDAILLPASFDDYRRNSQLFKKAVRFIAPIVEDRGIDEIFIDLTDIPEATEPLAQRLKAAVYDATGLTCSIGAAPNKLLAKIGSDLNKPNGITVLTMVDVPTQIWPLPAKKINGIGPRTAEKLAELKIHTIGELASMPAEMLIAHFGRSTGYWMSRVAQGIDESELVTEREPKSISRETTFERDLDAKRDRKQLSKIFTGLCFRVADDLRDEGYTSRTIGIKLKYEDFSVLTRDLTLSHSVFQGADIRKAAGECLKRVPLEQKIRLLGVKASGLAAQVGDSSDSVGSQGELQLKFKSS